MTALAAKVHGWLGKRPGRLPLPRLQRRWLPLLAVATLAIAPGELGALTRGALTDAYLQVSVFVTVTLALFYGLEAGLRIDTAALLERHRRWQVPVAALLGMTPGCGGAIVVMTAYARGRLGFGAVVATLTSTMGDAAFLLIAQQPPTAALVIGIAFVAGLAAGYLVDAVHGQGFLRPAPQPGASLCLAAPRRTGLGDRLWMALTAPGLALGILLLMQVEPQALVPAWLVEAIGTSGALLAFALWGRHAESVGSGCHGQDAASPAGQAMGRVTDDATFVSVWVAGAFLVYEIAAYLGLDVGGWFQGWAPLLPLLGVLVGLIPGCGPQVVVTALYLSGAAPLSALLGNAISNDGDALFPAMAIAPRAALVASLYTAVPALVVAYTAYGLGY